MGLRERRVSMRNDTKHEFHVAKTVSWALLGLGLGVFGASVIYFSSVLALCGLGLVFWGALLLYVQPKEYAQKVLLDVGLDGALTPLSQMTRELDYEGRAMYLPPRYFKDPEESKVYIPKPKDGGVPPSGSVLKLQDDVVFVRGYGTQGILLTPPGADLARLLEKTLGVGFTRVDVEYLVRNLPKLFIEDLDIAEDLEIEVDKTGEKAGVMGGSREEDCTVRLKVTNSIFESVWKENRELSYVLGKVGSPECSAIACALAKATGKLVAIENVQLSSDGRTLEVEYKVLGAVETEEQSKPALEKVAEAVRPAFKGRRMGMVSLPVAALGAALLCAVGYWTWFDVMLRGSGILTVFFGDRGLEGLGIGMKIIYYFVIGLALFLSGLIMFIRGRRRSSVL